VRSSYAMDAAAITSNCMKTSYAAAVDALKLDPEWAALKRADIVHPQYERLLENRLLAVFEKGWLAGSAVPQPAEPK
jgi:hypothetical protein